MSSDRDPAGVAVVPTQPRDGDVVLDIEDLSVSFPTEDGLVRAVRGLSYRLRRGEALGIVGESGSGKSVTSMAVMGLLPRSAVVEGSARVLGQEMVGLSDAEISRVRGRHIAMIFQDPLTSLNPVYTAGKQIAEAVQAHRDVTKPEAYRRAVELLELVGIPFPEQRVHSYPHELSGGMRQRVVIAIAMANNPDVIIADEPTTALDVTVQAQVLEAMEAARRETDAALVLITHDLGVVAGRVDRMAVMYAGKLVETGTVDDIYYQPRMPYTLGLLGSLPRVDDTRHDRLTPIFGTPPSLMNLPTGCPFAPRCPMAQDICREQEPELLPVAWSGPLPGPPATPAGTQAREAGGSMERAGEVGGGPGVEGSAGHAAACHFSDQLAGARPGDLFRVTSGVDTSALAGLVRDETGRSEEPS